MTSDPRNLNIPLDKPSRYGYVNIVGCMLVAWLWHRPVEWVPVLVSSVVGGAGVWFFFVSPLVLRWLRHRMPWVRGLVVILVVVGVLWWMKTVVPYASQWLAMSLGGPGR